MDLELNISDILRGNWVAHYAEGMGLETNVRIHKSAVVIRTSLTKETARLWIFILIFTLGLHLTFLLAEFNSKPETFDWLSAAFITFFGMFVLSCFMFWTLFLASQQNFIVEKAIKRQFPTE